MEEEDLQQMLSDLVENGKIKAAQRGRHVVYVAVDSFIPRTRPRRPGPSGTAPFHALDQALFDRHLRLPAQ